MKNSNDQTKLFLFFFIVVFLIAVFFITPSLQIISILTVLNVLFLSPLVKFLENKKLNRIISILIIFAFSGLLVGLFFSWMSGVAVSQWKAIAEALPGLSNTLLEKIGNLQVSIQNQFGIVVDFGLSNILSQAGSGSTSWLISHATSLLSSIASVSILVPIFSFFILKDGEVYKKEILKLVPTEHYSSIVNTLSKTSVSLSKFLRAKALEALIVAALVYLGLLIGGYQYAAVLAIIAGVTNILPYIGPVLGIIPAVALLGFEWPIFTIFAIVNAIDMLIIFPIFVGKLVNLSPLTLLVAVAVGQELYGLVGMLISVPFASILKIIYQEVVNTLYQD